MTLSVSAFLACFAIATQIQAAPDTRPAAARQTKDAVRDNRTLLQLARVTRSAGDLQAALGLYRQVAGPGADPALRVEYGDALLEAGQIDDAIGVYEAVDPLSPAEVDALLGLQRAHARLGQLDKALLDAQRAAGLAPGAERVQVSLGVSLDAAGRHAEAQASYRRALASSPRSIAARNDLALSLAVTGQYQEAIDILSPMAGSANASPRTRQNLALVYGLKGDRDRALALGRADLTPQEAEANQRFFDLARTAPRSAPAAVARNGD
jgi:Flp pilus assembly protein TadD